MYPGWYQFRSVRTEKKTKGSFPAIMIEECRKVGMKPLCEDKSSKDDTRCLYIGQDDFMTRLRDPQFESGFPTGFAAIKDKFPKIFCTYKELGNNNGRTACTLDGVESYWATSEE